MKIQAVIPSAGTGERLGDPKGKPFVELAGRPLIEHTLEVFEDCGIVDSVILVGHPDRLEDLRQAIDACGIKKVKAVVAGGKARRDSVANGLKALDEDTDIVLIHDGARPFVTQELIERLLKDFTPDCGVVAAVPVKPTIKRVDPQTREVIATLRRNELWDIQTPQIFSREVIRKAYEQSGAENVTDDASLVENLGLPVRIVDGEQRNIKITTPLDMVLAQQLLVQKGKG